jgi:hypothetical protein
MSADLLDRNKQHAEVVPASEAHVFRGCVRGLHLPRPCTMLSVLC